MIPAPLANRHTAVAVVVVTVLTVAFLVLLAVAPPMGNEWWWRWGPLLFVVHTLVLALAMFLVWRTLAPHTLPVAAVALAAMGGFALLALVCLVGVILPSTPWATAEALAVLGVAAVAAGVVLVVGLLGLGIAVLRHGAWGGPTRFTLLAAAVLLPVAVATFATGYPIPGLVGWALLFLGVAVGLRRRRAVFDPGLPTTV